MPDTPPASIRLAAWLEKYEICYLYSEVMRLFFRLTIAVYKITVVALLCAALLELNRNFVSLHKQRSFHLSIAALLLEY
jgi:hypothetical protein